MTLAIPSMARDCVATTNPALGAWVNRLKDCATTTFAVARISCGHKVIWWDLGQQSCVNPTSQVTIRHRVGMKIRIVANAAATPGFLCV